MARSRKSDDTREALLEAGARYLCDQGYHGTGLKELLAEVGVPKGSFYNYYPSKEAFGAAVIRRSAERSQAELDGVVVRAAEDALEALRAHFEAALRCYGDAGCRGGCLLGNLGAEIEDSEPCREALAEGLRGLAARYAAVLALGQAQGTIRRDVPAQDLAEQLLDSWEGAILRMKIERSLRPLERVLERLLEGDFLAPAP